jgi:hypothetical protein
MPISPFANNRYSEQVRKSYTGRVQFLLAAMVGWAILVPGASAGDESSTGADREPTKVVNPSATVPRLSATYRISAGLDGDIFPVFANYASLQSSEERKWGTIAVTINNPGTLTLHDRVAVKISGWSDDEIQTVDVPAGQSRTFKFAPSFLPRLYRNHEISAATARVEVSDASGRVSYEGTMPVRLRSVDDMYWGTNFKYAPFIASWVTPHSAEIEKILSIAKEKMASRRLPGYENWKSATEQEKSTELQARAIFAAVKQHGVSYVKSSMTFGGSQDISQRIRMPRESLNGNSANCIDGVVAFASLFENLGMDPEVVLVPGHAYVGVRTAQGGDHYLFIDTAQVAHVDFDSAVRSADMGLAKYGPAEITRIAIDNARRAGIYPMPE